MRTEVFAATLVQVNSHNSKVHVGFRVYPPELSEMLFTGSNSIADVCVQVSVVLKYACRHLWLHRIDDHGN